MGKKEDKDDDLGVWGTFLAEDRELRDKMEEHSQKAAILRKEENYKNARQYFLKAKDEENPKEAARKARHVLRPMRDHSWTRDDLLEEFVKEVEVFIETMEKVPPPPPKKKAKRRYPDVQAMKEISDRKMGKYQDKKHQEVTRIRSIYDIRDEYVEKVSHLLHREPDRSEIGDLTVVLALSGNQHPENRDLLFAWEVSRIADHQSGYGIERLQNWMEHHGPSAEAWYIIGLINITLSDYNTGRDKSRFEKAAIKAFEEAIKHDSQFTDSYWQIAFLELRNKRLKSFKNWIKRVAPMISQTDGVWGEAMAAISSIDSGPIMKTLELIQQRKFAEAEQIINQGIRKRKSKHAKEAEAFLIEMMNSS